LNTTSSKPRVLDGTAGDRGADTVWATGSISDKVELPSWFCSAQNWPVMGLNFSPST
jgi:hypothetical protein